MADKTIGQLRAEGKTFKEIAKIGEKQLKRTPKGRAALKRLKRSVGGRGGRAGKTQAQVEAEEKAKKLAEELKAKKLAEEKRLRAIEAKRIAEIKRKKEIESAKILKVKKIAAAKKVKPDTQEQQLRQQLSKTLGSQLASKIKRTKLAELGGLFSSEKKEIERKQLEQFIKASVPRTLKTEAQVKTLETAIKKETARRKAKPKLSNIEIKELSKLIAPSEQQKLEQLAITKQSMTPTQIAKLNQIKLVQGQKLNKAQWNNFKKVTLIAPSFNYGRNLVKRKQKGEKSPFATDFKEVFREAKAATFDTGYDIGTLLGKGARKSVIAAFNYGKRIQREAQKGNFVLDNDVKFIVSKITAGTADVVVATVRLTKFVKENPVEAALIAGTLTSQGTAAFTAKFKKDPVETFISLLLLKGINIGKVASGTPIGRFILEEKFIISQPKKLRPFVRAILKGAKAQEKLSPKKVKSLKKINFNEVLELNKIEAKAIAKTMKDVDGFIFGSLPARTIAGKKVPIPKDVDLAVANKSKFVKTFLNNLPKNQRKNYIVKGEKLLHKTRGALFDIKGYDRLRPNQSIFGTGTLPIYQNVAKKGVVLKPAALEIPTQPLIKVEGIKLVGFGEQTTRKGLGTLQVLIEKNPLRAKDPAAFIVSLKVQLAALKGTIPKSKIGKLLTFPKTLKADQLEKSIKILESKAFANLLDSKVAGLTNKYPILTKKLSSKKLLKVKSKTITQLVREKINKIKAKIKPVKKVTPKKPVAKKKPAVKKKPTPKKKAKPKKKPSKIPKKKKPSKIPIKKAKPSKIPKARKKPSKVPKKKAKPSRIPKKPTKPSRVPKAPTRPSRVPKAPPRPSRVPKGPPKVSRVPTKPSRVPKAPPTPKRVPPTKPKVPPKPVFKPSKVPKGSVRAYRVEFVRAKKRNLIFNGLPINKARKLIRDTILDKTKKTKSAFLLKRGSTKQKDINKVDLSKFRITKFQAQNKVGFIVRPKK